MKSLLMIVLPLVVLAGAAFGARAILSSAPEAERRAPPVTLPSVDATRLAAVDYAVLLRSQGTVRPTTEAAVVPEVVGTVTALHPDFVLGARFEAGDLLVQIDRRDYAIALTGALARLAQSEAALAEQRALADMAAADWRALGRGDSPSALMLREPQTAAAAADLDAARAEVERARLDLERTRIVAPWDGIVLARDVEVGQYVNRGAAIGRIHALDTVDVRLPVTARQLEFLTLPEDGTGGAAPGGNSTAGAAGDAAAPAVRVRADVGGTETVWSGALVRAEGIDEATQQLNVIARIRDPFASPREPLRVGRYVNAVIEGRTLGGVHVIPRAALREGREVLLIDADGTVRRRAVEVAWRDEDTVVVRGGLSDGEVLVTTPLLTIADGAPVRATIDGVPPPLGEGEPARPEGGPLDDTPGSAQGDAPDNAGAGRDDAGDAPERS